MSYGYIQHVANTGATGLTVSITPTAGNMLIAVLATQGNSSQTFSVSDGTNTWNSAGSIDGGAIGASGKMQIFYAMNVASGATTVTGTYTGGGSTGGLDVYEYSGLKTSSAFINFAGLAVNGPGSTTDALTSGNANATSQPALAFGFTYASLLQTTTTEAAGTGYTARAAVWAALGSGGTHAVGFSEDKRVTATGNVAATWTATSTDGGDVFLSAIALFAEATGSTSITSSAGAITLSGNAPTVTKPTVTAPAVSAGAITLAGVAPSVTQPTVTLPNPPVGSLTLTGNQPTQTLGAPAPGTGALQLTGSAPILPKVPAVGSLTLTGVGSVQGFGLNSTQGTLTLNGVASVLALTLPGSAGGLTLTGQASSLLLGTVRNALSGSIALTGAAPVLALGVSAGSGALAVSGLTVKLGLGVQPGTGTAFYSGATPALSGVAAPPAGALSLAGVGAVLGLTLTPSVGTLSYNGLTSTVTQGSQIQVPGGSVQYTGGLPAFGSTNIVPATATLTLVGQSAPSSSLTITPNTAQVVLTGTRVRAHVGYGALNLYLYPAPASPPVAKEGVY